MTIKNCNTTLGLMQSLWRKLARFTILWQIDQGSTKTETNFLQYLTQLSRRYLRRKQNTLSSEEKRK